MGIECQLRNFLALALMETWKNYKVPSANELFWMIPHDEDLPQQVNHSKKQKPSIISNNNNNHFSKVLPLPGGISIDPNEDYIVAEDGRRVPIFSQFVFLE